MTMRNVTLGHSLVSRLSSANHSSSFKRINKSNSTRHICSTNYQQICAFSTTRSSSTAPVDKCDEVSKQNHTSSDIPEEVAELVHKYSQKLQTSASLQTLMKTGEGNLLHKDKNKSSIKRTATERILMQVAGFIHHEMPIRLALRIKDLDRVPYLRDMPSVKAVKDIYISSFLTLIKEKPINLPVQETLFARKLELLYERHSSVLVQIARGAAELREAIRRGDVKISSHPNHPYNNVPPPGSSSATSTTISNSSLVTDFDQVHECQKFLERFYTSRIGIRVLAGQYMALREPPHDGYIGLICSHTSPYEVIKVALNDAQYMCRRKYGASPEVIIKGRKDLTFAYIETHLHYIMLELLKNALRATVEHHGVHSCDKWPPVEVIIADGQDNEDVVIKVADEGGGIPRSNMEKIWSYLFTTADPTVQQSLIANVDHSVDAPLAGLGYGLPISRSYARYWGGDLSIMSMEGYGSDCFVHLRRLGDMKEPLPV